MQTGRDSSSSVARPSSVFIRETELQDILELSVTMRQEDQDEIWHLARKTPEEALMQAYQTCEFNRTVLLDRKVVCIFGCGGTKGEAGIPWMLASPLLTKIKKTLLRDCRKWVEEMSEGYTFLYNVAWSKNITHVQWLHWLGFDIRPAIPMGPDGELYHEFFKVI